MTLEEIFQKARQVVGLKGMAVNERLSDSGFMATFDMAKKKDKEFAEIILFALKVDRASIDRILK